MKDRRRFLRRNQTETESLLWNVLRGKKLDGHRFFRQYSIGPYILDFYCSKLRLGIEVDGVQHSEDENVDYDDKREKFLSEHGIFTIRFKNSEVLSALNDTLEKIKNIAKIRANDPSHVIREGPTPFRGGRVSYNTKMPKTYKVKEKVSDDLVEQLLHNRGIVSAEEKEKFLNPNFVEHLYDPFLLPDMEKAVDRILGAIDANEKIGLWTDYDADGIPGGALFYDFFKQIGFNNFINYIPDRHLEGYGLNILGIEELANAGVKLLITVDCGIRDHEEILHAKKKGMDVIITDHHEPAFAPHSARASAAKAQDDLPSAFAIVNPKRNDSKYPEKVLCGSGVAWKLIEAILKKKRELLKEGQEKWLLDLVGIATLSDMVPLTGENRVLAYFGLSVLRKSRRPGLSKIFSMLRVNKNNLTEDDIGFSLTPRINAASRMGHPRDAFNLLIAENEIDAQNFALHLDKINNERKGVVAGIVKEAKKRIKEKFENGGEKSIIVLGNPDWRPALLGLAANSIADEYNRPVFLWGREGGEFIKGSCRSDGVTDLVSIMEKAKSSFVEFGGHKFSGGFAVDHEKIHTLEDALIDAAMHTVIDEADTWVDAEINLKDIGEKCCSQIGQLAPYGVGNEKPIFILKDVLPERVERFGKTKEHLSVTLRDGSFTKKAISFFASPDQFGDALKEGIKTNLVASIEKSFWNGSSEIRLRIVDFFNL